MNQKLLNQIRLRRKKRARAKFFGTSQKPRLSVFRSNRETYAQLIDDGKRETIVAASTRKMTAKSKDRRKSSLAEAMGEVIAKKGIEKGIKKIIFDRGKYKYHGRVRAVAEGARKGGLEL
ncbi:50S ribosomal protein L18 [Candidatus Wolfebacteria bacterium]|nr:50S ribosomal protein L18 [Candidatus Wolfebacteria bacterium]